MHARRARGGQHFDVADAERRKRIDQRVADRREHADIAGFAGTLDPERVGLGRHWIALAIDCREAVGAPHCVIHERAGQELPRIGVEADVLHQHLADSDLRLHLRLTVVCNRKSI